MLTMGLFLQVLVFDMLGILEKYQFVLGLFQVSCVFISMFYVVPMLPTEAVLTPTMAVAVNVKEVVAIKSYAMHVIPMNVYIASQPIVQAMMFTGLLDVFIKMQVFEAQMSDIVYIPSGVHSELVEYFPYMASEMINIPAPTLNAIASMTYYEVEGDMERLIKYFGDDLQLMW
jgi:hypothetical protein